MGGVGLNGVGPASSADREVGEIVTAIDRHARAVGRLADAIEMVAARLPTAAAAEVSVASKQKGSTHKSRRLSGEDYVLRVLGSMSSVTTRQIGALAKSGLMLAPDEIAPSSQAICSFVSHATMSGRLEAEGSVGTRRYSMKGGA
jgi:hypothetical protein